MYLRTFLGLSQDFLRTCSQLSQDFLRTFLELSQDFLRNFSGFSHNFPRTFSGLHQDILPRTLEIGPDCLGPITSKTILTMKFKCEGLLLRLALTVSSTAFPSRSATTKASEMTKDALAKSTGEILHISYFSHPCHPP